MAECVLLAAISGTPNLAASDRAQQLARRVQSLSQADGRVGTGPKRLDHVEDHDYLPGVALWALAGFARATGIDLLPAVFGVVQPSFPGCAVLGHGGLAAPRVMGWTPPDGICVPR